MDKLTFDDYAYHAWTTSYYLDMEHAGKYNIVHSGFNEEVGELLTDADNPTELTSKLWGIPIEDKVSQKLDEDKRSEAGDVLYFISAAGLLRNIPLRDIAAESIERYQASSAVLWDESFAGFDNILRGRMSQRVPHNYRPDYRTWKLWDFAPFEDGLHVLLREPHYAKGPLTLIPDGRYALERLCSTLGRFMSPEASTNEEFLAAAGIALGGLSIVLQARFNTTLTAAALNNIDKRERRQKSGALKDGIDSERSRTLGQERIYLTDEESTSNNLLNVQLPKN